ncbi:hypothetical protein IG631_18691 [Alternaria alternata]|nr:hypothetical protein IG631_18691 [Alternaria alternata]
MAWTAHAPSPTGPSQAGRSTSCPSHFASAATHDLGLAALYSSRSCAGGPFLVIDHRIMLDVESVPGPSLLTHLVLLRNRASRGDDPLLYMLGSCVRVAIAQDGPGF